MSSAPDTTAIELGACAADVRSIMALAQPPETVRRGIEVAIGLAERQAGPAGAAGAIGREERRARDGGDADLLVKEPAELAIGREPGGVDVDEQEVRALRRWVLQRHRGQRVVQTLPAPGVAQRELVVVAVGQGEAGGDRRLERCRHG